MGLLDGAIGLLNDIKMITSNDPFISGLRFEECVNDLFSEKYYTLVEKTHSPETNKEQYVESSMNPDFVFRHKPSKDLFAVECKYRSNFYNGVLEWSYTKQIQRYNNFSHNRRMPVFIIIGVEGSDSEPKRMFCIPLDNAKYPILY
ncbi:MAG: hypothetical protein D4R88_08450, partial [Methanosarcinales archaeon]